MHLSAGLPLPVSGHLGCCPIGHSRGGTLMATKRAKRAAKPKRPASKRGAKKATRKWSAGVSQRSDAMDLEAGVFKKRSARQIALSLKRSVESSSRRKSP